MRWDREKLPTPDSHVYGENGVEIMVYNVKRHSKRRRTKEKQKRKKGGRCFPINPLTALMWR